MALPSFSLPSMEMIISYLSIVTNAKEFLFSLDLAEFKADSQEGIFVDLLEIVWLHLSDWLYPYE